jgi:hypothetical protein
VTQGAAVDGVVAAYVAGIQPRESADVICMPSVGSGHDGGGGLMFPTFECEHPVIGMSGRSGVAWAHGLDQRAGTSALGEDCAWSE